MSTKTLFKLMVAFGVTALLLVFLGLNFVPRTSAFFPVNNRAANLARYAGSDWIERHPSAVVNSGIYTSSDYIERHASNLYDNSDWIERHPSAAVNSVDYSGSDYFERHPSDLYDKSDWIERHPTQPNL